jgi:hypothetical protein
MDSDQLVNILRIFWCCFVAAASAMAASEPIVLDTKTHKFISPLTVDYAGVTVLNFPITGGGTPGGINTQIQYNNAGVFGGLSAIPASQAGVPAAGGAGQVLSKNTTTDYDTGWSTISSSSEGTWSYTAGNNSMADPSNGKFRTDQSTFSASANIAVSTRTYDNIDRTNILANLKINDTVELQDKVNSANYARYELRATPTNNSTWFQLPVTWIAGGGTAPSGNSQVIFTFSYGTGSVPPVTSVFGRTGAVAAVKGDYNFALLGNFNWLNVKDPPYNAAGNGSTDDTVAIQTAINDVFNAGGGTVFFPKGTYLCNGAFDATTNSILKIPFNAQSNSPISISLEGEGPPPMWAAGTGSFTSSGTIIRSTKVGTGTEPAMLAGGPPNDGPANADFSSIYLFIRNMTFAQYDNPSIGGLRLQVIGGASLTDVRVDTYPVGASISHPTNGTTAVWMPCTNNLGLSMATRTYVLGHDRGFRVGEHFLAHNAVALYCNIGVDIMDSNELIGGTLGFLPCQTFLYFHGSVSVDFLIDAEQVPPGAQWYATTTNVIDVTPNAASGNIRYHMINQGVFHVGQPMTSSGVSKIIFTNLYTALDHIAGTLWNFVDPVDVTKKFAFDVSGITTGTTRTVTIPNSASTLISTPVTASVLLGRGSASSGAPQEITLGSNLSMSGTTLNATGAGGVTTFQTGNLSPLFTASPSSPTAGAVTESFTLSTAAANTVFGNNTASTAVPVFSSSPRFTAIGNLTTNGFITTSGGIGTLGVDTTTYVPTSRTLSIAGTSFDLSANRTWTQDNITGLSTTGIVKRTAANTLAIATAKTDYWDTTDMVGDGGGAGAHGLVPSPGSVAGTTKFLREDATWAVPAGAGGTPGGANTNIQYNDSSAFGGDANLTWNKTSFVETLTGNQNALTEYVVQNNSTGTAGQAVYLSKNSSHQANYGITSTGLTSSGDIIADQAYLYTDGTAGIGLFGNGGGGSVIRFAASGVTAQAEATSTDFRVNSSNLFAWTTGAALTTVDTGLARNAAGIVEVNNGTAGSFRDMKVRTITHNGYTVAGLPTGVAGMTAYVTDGTAALAWGATVTGGASTKYLVWYNGVSWTVIGK